MSDDVASQLIDAERLPLEVGDITAEWLGQALGREIQNLEVDEVIHGTATKVLIKATGSDGAVARLCVKGGFNPELMDHMSDAYQNEARFYGELGPRLEAGVPRCHYAAVDGTSGQGLVILDDLRELDPTYGDPRQPLLADTAAAALEGQASWHNTSPPGRWKTAVPHIRAAVAGLLGEENWNAQIETSKAASFPAELRDRERVTSGLRATWELDEAVPAGVCHGDANVTNLVMAADQRPWFLDWQFVCATHWAHDVSFFLIGAMDIEDRRTHEEDLIRHYVQARRALGADLDDETALDAHRRHTLHGLMYAFIPEAMQPAEICRPFADRFAAAATDHQTLRLLGI
jgi:hypothetical protein